MPAASLPIQRAILAAYIQGAAFHPLRPGACLKAFKSTCVPRPRASVALPLRSGAAAKSSPIPSPTPRFDLYQARRPPTAGVAGICSGCSPRPNGDSGATSLGTCRRCRLPTLLLVSDRLSEFSQPRTIRGFNNWLRLGLLAGKTNPFRRSPRTPVGDRSIPVSAYADTRSLHLAGSEGKRSLVIQLKYVRTVREPSRPMSRPRRQ
jgi:hypothetical protein